MDSISLLQKQMDVLKRNFRKVFTRVYLIDQTGKKVAQLEGKVINGSLSIDADSLIRRTGTINIAITNSSFDVGEDKYVWFGKRFRIEIGLEYEENDIVWFKVGEFILDETSARYSLTENTLSVSLLDNMCMFDADRGGVLDTAFTIEEGIPIHDVVSSMVTRINYPRKSIERSDFSMPYKIEKSAGESYGSVLDEVRNMYIEYEMFINLDGVFVFRKIKNSLSDSIKYSFDKDTDRSIKDISKTYNFKNVKNKVKVIGRTNPDTGVIPEYTAINDDPNSPFSISKIGEILKVQNESRLSTQIDVQKRAIAELSKATNLAEKVTITCVPIYILDVNDVVYIKDISKGLDGKYQIKSMTIPLEIENLMTINCVKIY